MLFLGAMLFPVQVRNFTKFNIWETGNSLHPSSVIRDLYPVAHLEPKYLRIHHKFRWWGISKNLEFRSGQSDIIYSEILWSGKRALGLDRNQYLINPGKIPLASIDVYPPDLGFLDKKARKVCLFKKCNFILYKSNGLYLDFSFTLPKMNFLPKELHIFYRQLGCVAFSLRFWPKIRQLLRICPASDRLFLSKQLIFAKSCKNQVYKTKQLFLSNF